MGGCLRTLVLAIVLAVPLAGATADVDREQNSGPCVALDVGTSSGTGLSSDLDGGASVEAQGAGYRARAGVATLTCVVDNPLGEKSAEEIYALAVATAEKVKDLLP